MITDICTIREEKLKDEDIEKLAEKELEGLIVIEKFERAIEEFERLKKQEEFEGSAEEEHREEPEEPTEAELSEPVWFFGCEYYYPSVEGQPIRYRIPWKLLYQILSNDAVNELCDFEQHWIYDYGIDSDIDSGIYSIDIKVKKLK